MCEREVSTADVFNTMKKFHEKSFQDIGGKYIPQDENEKTCAIRLAPHVFFKVLLGLGMCLRRERAACKLLDLAVVRCEDVLTNGVGVYMWNVG